MIIRTKDIILKKIIVVYLLNLKFYFNCITYFSSAGYQIEFIDSKKNGGKLLVINGFRFFRNKKRGNRQYWKCSNYYKEKCPAIAIYDEVTLNLRLCHHHIHNTTNTVDLVKPFTFKKDTVGHIKSPNKE